MEELKKIIVELNGVFKELIPIEKNKLTAAADHNVVELEECMKREQVAILQNAMLVAGIVTLIREGKPCSRRMSGPE